ncbi:hypothetical protein [uncultured Cohaesibacter sp.]|uniref:hypothetical protein n=1 Tax=uncultured Cohaesibacter sp. TaxID=1002546 RepID=UPI00292E37E8|nr:hypothetical protein [uncultured Cohaesibacter sp.]
MDISVQKMQPPATVQGKSAAKKTNLGTTEDAVETAEADQEVEFKHGNTAYSSVDPDERNGKNGHEQERKGRRKNRQLLSQDDLSELTTSIAELQKEAKPADGLLHMRAYQAPSEPEEDDERPHFEVNI